MDHGSQVIEPLRETDETVSLANSIEVSASTLTMLASLPARIDDEMLATVDRIALSPVPALPACDDGHLDKCLKVMDAALPRRAADGASGPLMLKAYRRKLEHLPEGAISYLADQVLERCEWFPSIAECLRIAGEWERRDEAVAAKAKAEAIARRERQQRLDDARHALRAGRLDQNAIDRLPSPLARILAGEGLLWACEGDCGTYVCRPSAAGETAVDTPLTGILGRLSHQFPSRRGAA